ncbi:hypothetical protein PENANT_c020G03767 [Penicillium antarcticum]|uniref:DUF1774-domain-containing protein n=1 Tax=Penicillium antarcticum TaxID=416450 RepID=A0A1V6Q0H5_9EURO|nr:uncharacterized protein N7508_004470 [Penicillium antarcticum]KAJ5309091.1 hypothetical protein N7508_004470 [Penicillium antarcticum]OQD82725.1 hypothetical protein PENANT_c020G03767 [Penicillium antarcticum]
MVSFNPFARRETHSASSLNTYRVLVPLTWALVVVVGIYYSVHSPDDVKKSKKIWKQANKRNTPFSQNTTLTGIYWILLLLSQLSYVYHLFSKNNVLVTAAANVATHFILNNLFLFVWILLWTRNYFWGAEVVLIFHFLNQWITYWRHRGLPAFVHLPAVAGPYAWTLTALFWNGAVAVHSHNLPGRIVANIFIWVILVVGLFDIVLREDYILGYCLSILTLSLALRQVSIKIIALQWIFAFVVFAVFLVVSIYISATKYTGRDSLFRRVAHPESTDRERAPLLNEQV